MTAFVLALVCGALYEALAVAWVHFAERKRALAAALCSGGCAVTLVTGVGESLKAAPGAVGFVLGYALGTFVAVKVKR